MSTPEWPRGPYILATSNSWRRFLDRDGRSVCEPTVHRLDKHPDLHLAPGVGPLFEAAPALYEALDWLVEAWPGSSRSESLQQAREALAKARGEETP